MKADAFTRREVNRALLVGALSLVAHRPIGRVRAVNYLFDFAIAGGWYHGLGMQVAEMAVGQRLRLGPEPGNPHDRFAVAVHIEEGIRLGYIPRIANQPVFDLLSQGARIEAVVVSMLDIHRASEIPDDLVFTGFSPGDPRIRLSVEQS